MGSRKFRKVPRIKIKLSKEKHKAPQIRFDLMGIGPRGREELDKAIKANMKQQGIKFKDGN